MKRLSRVAFEAAFEHFRRCGAGRDECVVYFTGPVDDSDLIDAVIHPRHTSSPAGYDLDSDAIGELWSELSAQRRSVRLQAHTHPGSAFHSSRDDALALIGTVGFLSLVIPNFASGEVGFDDVFLAERTDAGDWASVPVEDRLELVP